MGNLSGSNMNACWLTFSVAWVIINLALGLPDPGLVEVQDGWKANGTLIQPDEQRIPTNQQTHMHEVSDPKARKESSNTWSRCVKKNLINYVTEYENMMQCNVIYEQECHQVPKQVCSMTQINPKQIEKPYTQTICYNDNDDAEDVPSKIGDDGMKLRTVMNPLFKTGRTGGYIKVFSHDVSGGLFTNYDVGTKNPEDPDNKLYSILDQLEDYRSSVGKFQFKLCYPELTWGLDEKTCNEWIQTSNPYTESSITGFQEIFLAFDRNSNNDDWRGIGKNLVGNDVAVMMDDSPDTSNWFSAIGAKSYWGNGTIPGPRHPTDHNTNSQISIVELFVKE